VHDSVVNFAAVQVIAPGVLTTVYLMIGVPFGVAAAQVTLALPGDAVADALVGAVGSLEGVAGFEGADAGPVPVVLVARTRKV